MSDTGEVIDYTSILVRKSSGGRKKTPITQLNIYVPSLIQHHPEFGFAPHERVKIRFNPETQEIRIEKIPLIEKVYAELLKGRWPAKMEEERVVVLGEESKEEAVVYADGTIETRDEGLRKRLETRLKRVF